MKGLVLVSLAVVFMLLFGCTQYGGYHPSAQPAPNAQPAGGNAGIPNNGKSATPPAMPGSDRDEHGCIGSAGYVWCNITQQCVRPWEFNCTKPTTPAENISGEKEGAPETNYSGTDEKMNNSILNMSLPKTITGYCHDEVVPAHYCINENDTSYTVYDAQGIGTGVGYESVDLMNMDTVTVNCSIQFKITPYDEQMNLGTPYYSQNYTVTLEPGQWKNFVQYYHYRYEDIDDPFMGLKTVHVCEPLPDK